MAEQEILHFRDWRLSKRHRDVYGRDCPMVDIDFLVVEYGHCTPRALVEYKHASPVGLSVIKETAGLRTEKALADMAGLPAWVAFYRPYIWDYKIYSLNDKARAIFGPGEYVYLCERAYVEKLYQVRGYPFPQGERI